MDTKDLQQMEIALARMLPDILTDILYQVSQSNKSELSGLHTEIRNDLKLLTANSITNTGRIEAIQGEVTAIKDHLKMLNGKVATQEGRWVDQAKTNTENELSIKALKENDTERTNTEKQEVSDWRNRIITGVIVLFVAILVFTGILNLPK